MKTFQNKTVFLTGAASGIGRELALQLARSGCHLYLVDIDEAGLQRLVTEIGTQSPGRSQWIQTQVCNLADADDVAATLQHFDENVEVIDVVINNAGIAFYGPTETMSPQQWDRLMRINLLSPIQITSHFLPQLLERPDAHVVNMCSVAGLVAGGRFAAYNTSKFGLIGYTESLRAEYGRKGIGVTAICPGPVVTNLYEAAESGHKDRKVPVPPRWACATAQQVATKTVKAMLKNRRQVLITPMAHVVSRVKRFAPGLLDAVAQFSRKRRRRLAELQAKEDRRLQDLQRRQATGQPSAPTADAADSLNSAA
ncbi:MAG: SDR family oxidoreductase [Fuerstiella sp.]